MLDLFNRRKKIEEKLENLEYSDPEYLKLEDELQQVNDLIQELFEG